MIRNLFVTILAFILLKARNLILGAPKGILVDSENGLMVYNPFSTRGVDISLYRRNSACKKELAIISKLLKRGDSVCILGTHIGSLLIPIAKRVEEVVGYEASPSKFFTFRNQYITE